MYRGTEHPLIRSRRGEIVERPCREVLGLLKATLVRQTGRYTLRP